MKASSSWLTLPGSQLLLYLLTQVLTITGLSSVDTGHFYLSSYKGVVGGNVSFYCPVDVTKKLIFLYFQKAVVNGKPIFLNGYHSSKPLTTHPNTEMDKNNSIMHVYGLNLSDSGEYECHYMYEDDVDKADSNLAKHLMHLNVTALFSKPVITNTCKQADGIPLECDVKCESHNGFPVKKIEWTVLGSISKDTWKTTHHASSGTGLLNISSTASFNCSCCEVKVSCSVDGITSDISVCSPIASPDPSMSPSIAVIAAGALCGLVVIVLILVLYCKFKKRTTEAEDVAANGQLEEVRVLTNLGEEKPGS